MFVPRGDDRYFSAGNDQELLQHIPLYSDEEFEREYPRIISTMPEMFSLNLRQEIASFLVTAPPEFGVAIDSVLEVGCFYYCDWDTVKAVTDEFIQAEVVERVRKSLLKTPYNGLSADERLTDLIVMLGGAITDFIGIIIGVLSRTGAPAIMDYGCCYRYSHTDPFGNVYFKLSNPTQVYEAIEELLSPSALERQHCTN